MKTLFRRIDSTEIEAPEESSYEGHWVAKTNKTVFVYFDCDPDSEQCGWNFWTVSNNTIWGTWDSKAVCETNAVEWYENPEHGPKSSQQQNLDKKIDIGKHKKYATRRRANRLQQSRFNAFKLPRKNILTNKHDQETQLEQEVYKLIEKVKNEKKDLNWRQWFRIEETIDLLITDVQKKMMDCKRLTEQEERDNPNYYHN